MHERLQAVIDEMRRQKLINSVAEFVRYINFPQEQTVRDVLNGRVQTLSGELVYSLYRAGVNLDYLYNRKKPILLLDESPRGILDHANQQAEQERWLRSQPELRKAMEIFIEMLPSERRKWIAVMKLRDRS